MKQLTNFTLDEFDFLSDLIHGRIEVNMPCGRLLECANTYQRFIFMLRIMLEHGGEWTFSATFFKKHVSTCERTIIRFFSATFGDLEKGSRCWRSWQRCRLQELVLNERRFEHLPSTLIATNVNCHPSNRLQGNNQETALDFSGKQHLYRFNWYLRVSDGLGVFVSSHFPV